MHRHDRGQQQTVAEDLFKPLLCIKSVKIQAGFCRDLFLSSFLNFSTPPSHLFFKKTIIAISLYGIFAVFKSSSCKCAFRTTFVLSLAVTV